MGSKRSDALAVGVAIHGAVADVVARSEPFARLFSTLANWSAALMMSSDRVPEIDWGLKLQPDRRWRLRIVVDGDEVFAQGSTFVWQLLVDGERAFRAWADDRDQKENEARLDATLSEMIPPHH
jgi:hypothetical protein